MTTLHMRRTRTEKVRRVGPRPSHGRRMADALAALLDGLHWLIKDASTDNMDPAGLQWLCELGLRVLPAGACALYVKETHQAGLRLAATAGPALHFPSACPPELLKPAGREAAGADGAAAVLTVPVFAETCRCGLLVFVGHRWGRFIEDDLSLASRFAQLAALALRIRALRDLAAGSVRPEVLMWEALDPIGTAGAARTAAQARRLGHDLSVPHVVIVGKAVAETAAERLHRNILRAVPHGLADLLGTTIIAIVPAGRLPDLAAEGLSIGVSRPCADLERYPAAYREAQEAVDIGTKLFGPGRVTHVEDLESYRFIPTFIKGGLTDVLEYQMMSRLPDDLLKTLEVYLDSGGNATRAARQLFLHRNTLRQRLDRIAALLNVDLTTSERWLPLQLAVKAARLARLTPGATAGGSGSASDISATAKAAK
jgi:PucR C-terminal helix-turn-helix domain/GGDEF-like domain/GAF domain